jgi:hypothetical protein
MAKHGVKVAIIKENQKVDAVISFLKQHFSPKMTPQT